MENKWKTSTVVLLVVALILSALLIVQYASEDKDFEVSFDSDGGTEIASQTVQKDAVVIRPGDPQKDGFVFSHWQFDSEEFDFSTPVTTDITLKAVYTTAEIDTADITLIFDDGFSGVNAVSILEGRLLLLADPVREGYKFVRWESDGVEFDFTGSLSDGMKIYAVWEEIPMEYSVNFFVRGGSRVPRQMIMDGETVREPDTPTREGYTFLGWFRDGEKYDFSQSVTESFTLMAEWETAATTTTTTPATTTTTTTTTTTKKADVYTYTFRRLDDFSPQYIITILKNGSAVGAAEVYDGNFLLGNRYNDKGVILIDGSELYNINRAKLNDGTNVNISK